MLQYIVVTGIQTLEYGTNAVPSAPEFGLSSRHNQGTRSDGGLPNEDARWKAHLCAHHVPDGSTLGAIESEREVGRRVRSGFLQT